MWPPHSPDLNLIENAWGEWKRRVAERGPKDVVQLERVAVEEWTKLANDRGYVAKLFGSMKARLEAVVVRNGGFTPY